MPYAFVAQVELDPANRDQNQGLLQERLIPFMKSQPGFVPRSLASQRRREDRDWNRRIRHRAEREGRA